MSHSHNLLTTAIAHVPASLLTYESEPKGQLVMVKTQRDTRERRLERTSRGTWMFLLRGPWAIDKDLFNHDLDSLSTWQVRRSEDMPTAKYLVMLNKMTRETHVTELRRARKRPNRSRWKGSLSVQSPGSWWLSDNWSLTPACRRHAQGSLPGPEDEPGNVHPGHRERTRETALF